MSGQVGALGRARALARDPGCWTALLLASLLAPAVAHVAAFHRSHWLGPAPDDTFWPAFVVPWAARGLVALTLVALCGWAAFGASTHPARARRVVLGAAGGLLLAAACTLASVPGWIWLIRLGAAPAPRVFAFAGAAGLALLVGGAMAGAAGAVAPAGIAALAGTLGGLSLYWLVELSA